MRATLIWLASFYIAVPCDALRPETAITRRHRGGADHSATCGRLALPFASRRSALCSAATATLLSGAQPARALFESKEQLALVSLATAEPKLRSLIAEVTEVKRRRIKMATDKEDDAYVFRFARAVLDPAAAAMVTAAPALKDEDTRTTLPAQFKESVASLDAACRAYSAADELDALVAAEKALAEFLAQAKAQKYDVRPRDDINGYEGATGVLYNKFLFRSG